MNKIWFGVLLLACGGCGSHMSYAKIPYGTTVIGIPCPDGYEAVIFKHHYIPGLHNGWEVRCVQLNSVGHE